MDVSDQVWSDTRAQLRRRGVRLEYITLAWNVVGVIVLAAAAIAAGSVALAGFGLDSLIEIGASIVVVWQLGRAIGIEQLVPLAGFGPRA